MCTVQDAANGLNGYKMGEKTLVVKMAGSRGPPPGQGCVLALAWMHTLEIPKDRTDTCCSLFAFAACASHAIGRLGTFIRT